MTDQALVNMPIMDIFFSVPSLKEACKLFVIKKGTTRIDLPTTLAEELDEMEGRMKSIFTGTFHIQKDFSVTTLTIAWTQGQWEFTMKNQKIGGGVWVIVKTLVIKSGVENSLGKLGGELFMLPGRKVSIFDFRLDVETKMLRFNGMCSSSEEPRGRSLNIVLGFEKRRKMEMNVLYRTSDRPKTKTIVFNAQTFFKDNLDRDPEVSSEDINDSDSDSSFDMDIGYDGF